MGTRAEKKGSGFKWVVGAVLLAVLLLLNKCGGKIGPMLSGDDGATLSQPSQTVSNVSPSASTPTLSTLDKSSGPLKIGSEPEEGKVSPDIKVPKENTSPTIGSVATGSHTTSIQPNRDNGKQQGFKALPIQTVEENVPLEGRPLANDQGDLLEPEGVAREKASAVTIKEKKENPAKLAGFVQQSERVSEKAWNQLDPRGGTGKALVQTQQLNAGDRNPKSLAKKLPEVASQIGQLPQQMKGQDFLVESQAKLAVDEKEAANSSEKQTPASHHGDAADKGLVTKLEISPEKTLTDTVAGISFVLVKGGCFQMGSNDGDSDERPVHEVCVDDFYLGQYEITQAQYEKVMEQNPSSFKGGERPVESVSWEDAQAFIAKLNQESGMKYRLPSEAEWEYAALNGGKDETLATTSDEPFLQEHACYINNIGNHANQMKRQPNKLGLYDMTGNVWEWVSDWYGANYYASSPRTNPQGPQSGSHRVIRAGSGSRYESQRYGAAPNESYDYFGFRVAIQARF